MLEFVLGLVDSRMPSMRMRCFSVGATFFLAGCAFAATPQDTKNPTEQSASRAEHKISNCATQKHAQIDYVVCRFDPEEADIRLFLNDAEGQPYGHFTRLKAALQERGESLIFAMNGGMYHKDRSPVGFYVENEIVHKKENTNDGPGNFHMKPNGVFIIDGNGFWVAPTSTFLVSNRPPPIYATQSGPMLVIDGELHPRFLVDSDSRKRRNGVGVTEAGEVIFVLADTPVNFYQFAVFFRDELKTPNALYLDGTISRVYAPEVGRNDPGAAMGPIIGVVAKQ
ncbi:MAG: hypothetical protein DHS20C05_11200 [Hyphococcus sp.]|nr:MAG: hypothetical protein DHS20C05_11200 [Marinicaulis sp.]